MTLRLTNTINRKKEVFHSLLPGKVSIYCCGVTVYDLCHLGHARSYISWDVLRRYLIWKGYDVSFVQNFTDIDDKILRRAEINGCSMYEVSEKNIQEFYKDMDSLGILRPDRMPRATKCLDGILSCIKELVEKGFAYSVDGDVYFSVLKKNNYGKLSGRNLLDQKINPEGRIASNEEERKKHPFDFALWKNAKDGEPSFSSPWGEGRPGWHIECSAMVKQELGDTIDIHLGGSDLIFPHHENEIAQSECLTGKELARYWLHNGMVNVDGQKMSKSLGNFTTIRDLLKQDISPMALRLFVLQAHYRKPLDFTKESLESASIGWKGLNIALSIDNKFPNLFIKEKSNSLENNGKSKSVSKDQYLNLKNRFLEAMDDDLNTSAALSIIFEIARPIRSVANRLERMEIKNLNPSERKDLYIMWTLLIDFACVLGLRSESTIGKAKTNKRNQISEEEIKLAIEERKKAKLERNYKKADQIRSKLKTLGIDLIDKPGGITEWIES